MNRIEISAKLIRETKAAYLINDGSKEVWLPKSQVEIYDTANKDLKMVMVPEWLAKDKGLI